MKLEENNELCAIIYKIRDKLNDNDSLGALSLTNDLYFDLLRITIQDGKITCKDNS